MTTERKAPKRIAASVINSLKGGVVPRIGLPYITVGRKNEIAALINAALNRRKDAKGTDASNSNPLTYNVLDTQNAKTEGTDYTKSYDDTTHVITFTEKTVGSLGNDALTVTYNEITVSTVSKTPANGTITIASAADIILDSVSGGPVHVGLSRA